MFDYAIIIETFRTLFPSGAETGWMDLTALAVVSIELFNSEGTAIHVSDPIHVSVPLPSDTHNRMATSVPTWLYQPKTGSVEIILYSDIDHW